MIIPFEDILGDMPHLLISYTSKTELVKQVISPLAIEDMSWYHTNCGYIVMVEWLLNFLYIELETSTMHELFINYIEIDIEKYTINVFGELK